MESMMYWAYADDVNQIGDNNRTIGRIEYLLINDCKDSGSRH